jgi:hypothetical protein
MSSSAEAASHIAAILPGVLALRVDRRPMGV